MSWSGQRWRRQASGGRGLGAYEVWLRGEAAAQLRAEMGDAAYEALGNLDRIDAIIKRAKELAAEREAMLRAIEPL